jgi:hypothetical protein
MKINISLVDLIDVLVDNYFVVFWVCQIRLHSQ